jgi:23S rRNA (uracil1939-C5)-methyltransferase
MKRGEIYTVPIHALSSEGMGVGRIDNKVVFVPYTTTGDEVEIEITKSKSSFAEAKILQLLQPSDTRVAPVCPHFGVCGGCKTQHVAYSEQLKQKEQSVYDAFARIGKVETPNGILPITGCDEPFHYRNKLEFGFTDRRWLTWEALNSGEEFDRNGVGFHVPGSFSAVLDIDTCYLMKEPVNALRNGYKHFAIANGYTFFDLKHQHGFLRNLLIRITSLNEILVLLSVHENDEEKIQASMDYFLTTFPEITSLQYVVNPKRNDTIYDLEPVVVKGESYIHEKLGDYTFKIGPKSFFQTNSRQAKRLYDITKEFAGLKGDEIVYDLYTGVGSIALYVSDSCRHVVGVEQIEPAIADAKENALLNHVTNTSFYAGDVRMIVNSEFIAKHGRPQVVITDPPRAGMHEDVVKTLLELAAPRIVYVSCNPATQARDLQLLSEKYIVNRVQPVDMFPNTAHIENVVQLELKKD